MHLSAPQLVLMHCTIVHTRSMKHWHICTQRHKPIQPRNSIFQAAFLPQPARDGTQTSSICVTVCWNCWWLRSNHKSSCCPEHFLALSCVAVATMRMTTRSAELQGHITRTMMRRRVMLMLMVVMMKMTIGGDWLMDDALN